MLSGAIGSLLAQGLEPFAAARLGVYLHGVAGDGIRERFGDAGLLASDLPEGLAIARKRPRRDRRTQGEWQAARVCGARGAGRPRPDPLSGRAPVIGRPRDRAAGRGRRSRRVSRQPACRRCRGPPGWRSTSTPCGTTSRRSAAWPDRASRSCPWSRPTPTAMVRSPVARALEDGRGRTASAWPRSTRRSSCARGASPRRILVLYPIPAAWAAKRPRLGIAVTAGDAGPARRRSLEAAGTSAPGSALESSSRSRPGSVAAVSSSMTSSLRRRRIAASPGAPAGRPLDPPPGGGGRRADPAQVARFEAARRTGRGRGSRCPPATSPPARR